MKRSVKGLPGRARQDMCSVFVFISLSLALTRVWKASSANTEKRDVLIGCLQGEVYLIQQWPMPCHIYSHRVC